MVELELRMLTKRPTVARTSERGIRLVASRPTLAREPRTEITRPRELTAIKPWLFKLGKRGLTMPALTGQTVKPAELLVGQIPFVLEAFARQAVCRPEAVQNVTKIAALYRRRRLRT